MMINALNSGARGFMADCEDALSPTWQNVVDGQVNLADAGAAETIAYDASEGKHYEFKTRSRRSSCARAAGTCSRST